MTKIFYLNPNNYVVNLIKMIYTVDKETGEDMKKLTLSLLILLLSISMIGFTGCKDPEIHEHEFSDSW